MNQTAHRICAWAGIGSMVLFGLGLWIVAGFVPPPSPKDDSQEIVQMFQDDTNRIRTGMIICIFAAALIGPWVASVGIQMRRIEGRYPVLTWTWLICGTALVVEFIFLFIFWQVAAFRPDRGDDLIYLLNDMAWVPMICLTSTTIVQGLVLAVAILLDTREEPIFPRWAGYLNIWVIVCLSTGTFTVYFKDGPMGWNGILVWWIPVVAFAAWMITNSVLVMRAINKQETELDPPHHSDDDHSPRVDRLTVEVESLRRELATVVARTH